MRKQMLTSKKNSKQKTTLIEKEEQGRLNLKGTKRIVHK